ncbi:glycosyltransferase family 2 protein [Bradyrhizobium sp. UFLA05-153]
MDTPELTIGLPVYNGAPQLATAVDSLLNQTFRNFVLVISDNASTDETASICQAAAQNDSRVVYVRQPSNIGAFPNFRYLLDRASTPYFMWAAHDDRWDPTFVEKNLALLKLNPQAIASISRVEFQDGGRFAFESTSTFPLQGDVRENLSRFWQLPKDASRFYSIHRTDLLRRCVPNIPPYHAYDWLVIALTLTHGHYLEVPEVLMWRGASESDRYLRQVKRDNRNVFLRAFPLLPTTYYALRLIGLRQLDRSLLSLIRLNLLHHQTYVAFAIKHHPWLFRPLRWTFRIFGLNMLFDRWRQHPKDSRSNSST